MQDSPKNSFKFDGFEPANTTPVPDVFFDELMPHLNEAQLKAMLYIIRRTLGFKKTSDAISLKQFRYGIITKDGKQLDQGCGLRNYTTILRALRDLEEMGCVESEKRETEEGDSATTVYRVRFRGTASNAVPPTPNAVPTARNGVGGVLRETDDGYCAKRSRGTTFGVGGVLRETESQETVLQLDRLQETDRQESVSKIVVTQQILSQSANASSHAFLNKEKSLEEKTEPPLSEPSPKRGKSPAKKDAGPPPEPGMSGAWTAETVVQYAEFCNKRYYTDLQRKKELEAARAIHRDDPDLTLEHFKQAYDQRNDSWWAEHKGKLHTTDLKRDDRIHKMLDLVQAQKEKAGKKKAPPKPWQVQTEKDFDRSPEAVQRAEEKNGKTLEKAQRILAEKRAREAKEKGL